MTLELNLGRLLGLFLPLYGLMLLSVAAHPSAWAHPGPTEMGLAVGPIGVALLLYGLGRGRWRLEIGPDALVHHTLGRTERFEWRRMGEVALAPVSILHIPLARTLWFRYPLDPQTLRERATHLSGRRLLLVFGDLTPTRLLDEIEAARTRATAGA